MTQAAADVDHPRHYGALLLLLVRELEERRGLTDPSHDQVREALEYLRAFKPATMAKLDALGLERCPGYLMLLSAQDADADELLLDIEAAASGAHAA